MQGADEVPLRRVETGNDGRLTLLGSREGIQFALDHHRPFLTLRWEDGTEVASSEIEWNEQQSFGSRLVIGGGNQSVSVSMDIRFGTPFTSWDLAITNMRTSALQTAEVSVVAGLKAPDDWVCTLPFSGGWAIPVGKMLEQSPVRLRYPVQGCMQWVEIFGKDYGVSVFCRDPEPLIKDFAIWRDEAGMNVSISHPHLSIGCGERFALPPILAGLHEGTWHYAAKTYADWLATVVPSPSRAPEWLQKSPAWAWASGKGQYASKIENRFDQMPDVSSRFAESGVSCVQLAAWVEHGHDTRYPDYVAGDSLGGEDALRAAVDDIHSQSRKLALYTNGRLFDPLSNTATEHPGWREWAIQAPEGKRFADSIGEECVGVTNRMAMPDWDPDDEIAKEIYGKVTFAVMCPGGGDWAQVYSDRLTYAAERYQIDGLYLDQVLGAVAVPCYSAAHGHDRPSAAWTSYHRLLDTVRSKVKSVRPEAYLATEGFSDILGQYFDLAQSHNDWRGPCPEGSFPFPEMTRHAVPWLMQALGPVREGQWDMLKLAHAGASGLDIACFGSAPQGEFSRAIRQVMQWRERFGQAMYGASTIACEVEDFPANRAVALLGDELIVCWSMSEPGNDELVLRLECNLPDEKTLRWESTSGSGICSVQRMETKTVLEFPPAQLGIVYSE